MTAIIEEKLKKYCPLCRMDNSYGYTYYSIFRILVALMFMSHGAQKLFGAFGGVGGSGEAVPAILTLFGIAGIIEFFGGLLVALGIFVRPVALIVIIEMLVAYFRVHLPNGSYPLVNGGELVVLFFASFLLMARLGAGKWSLERAMVGKEIF